MTGGLLSSAMASLFTIPMDCPRGADGKAPQDRLGEVGKLLFFHKPWTLVQPEKEKSQHNAHQTL